MDYKIYPPEELIDTTINLPLSKSVTNRVLIMKAISGIGMPEIENDMPDDIKALINGINNQHNRSINIGPAGTAMRFLTAYYAAQPGLDIIIDGSDRMRERPIEVLVTALKELGADIESTVREGFPPLHIRGRNLNGGKITVKSDISSQYITALMLIAPTMSNGLEITLEGETVSKAYILTTLHLMQRYGIDCDIEENIITINPGIYNFDVDQEEVDWTAASYWAQIVALSAGFVTLPGLSMDSVQGDKAVADFFSQLGVITEESEDTEGLTMMADPEVFSRINIDLTNNPDLAQTIAVTALLLNIPFRLTGLKTLKIKETNRIEALQKEFKKFGCDVESQYSETLEWDGRRVPIFEVPTIETYNDHRMAMAFAPAALYIPGIIIKDVEVVNKSYPSFWNHLKAAGFTIEEV